MIRPNIPRQLSLAGPARQQLASVYRLRRCQSSQAQPVVQDLGDKLRLTLTSGETTSFADIRPEAVRLGQKELVIQWPGHPESVYPFSVLKRAAYDPPLQKAHDRSPTLWTAEIGRNPPSVGYRDVTQSGREGDLAVLKWLDLVDEFGFCYVTGVPVSPDATEQLIRKMGTIRETHYGGFWDFTADMSLGDLAYSNQALPAHTDTTYFTDPAGLQIFHCLHHDGNGGESLLVDGFYAASQLSPNAYETLRRLKVPTHASGNADHLLRPASHETLTHDEAGLLQVRWNNEDRGNLGPGWSARDVNTWYSAAREFEAVIRSEEAEYWTKLQPGTVVVINNWRVLHGRSAFDGARRMCGAYVGADDWQSRRRALKAKIDGVPGVKWDSGW